MNVSAVPSGETAQTILLVEDEPMLRRIVAITLRADGFRVIDAPDGAAGLAILQSGEVIDALLTDVRMPGLSGFELAEASLALRPALPVILMTGYTDEEMPDALRQAAVPLLRKPFDFESLGASVRKFIAER